MLDAYITAAGGFGQAVAQKLAAEYDTRIAAPEETADSSRWHRARVHVVAAWRETPSLFDLADSYAFITGRPWLPITLDAASLRVGPLVTGKEGPCYRCFLGRQYQHRRLREMDRRLFSRYDTDLTCGVAGFLAAHVSLAASAAGFAITAAADGSASAERGRVRRFTLLSPQVSVFTVIPVHGCARCGRQQPDATWAALAQDMLRLPPGRADEATELTARGGAR